MTANDTRLGGRIALLEPRSMSGPQKDFYDAIMEKAVPWAQSSGFVAALPNGQVIGPFNVALHSPVIGAAFAKLQSIEESNTTFTQRVRQVVILTVGAAWQCDYERYAHKAIAKKAKLPEADIALLADGAEPQGLAENELLAWRLTRELIEHHRVSQDLFEKAQATFGNQGIVDLLFLAGCYGTVCSLLNTFEVPDPHVEAGD